MLSASVIEAVLMVFLPAGIKATLMADRISTVAEGK